MKSHFQKLLNYNSWANRSFLQCLLDNTVVNNRAYLIMSHLLTAEAVWLSRLTGGEGPIQKLWEQHTASEIEQMLQQSSNGWEAWINNANDHSLLQTISYKNSKGETFLTQVADIISHMINHGTHHRGQISLLLQQEGVQPPVSDYIAYQRLGKGKS